MTKKLSKTSIWDLSYQGHLVGIAASVSYSRLAIELNNLLQVQFKRAHTDHVLKFQNEKVSFVVLEAQPHIDQLTYQLFQNKSGGYALVKSLAKQFDYFLLTLSDEDLPTSLLKNIELALKSCDVVLTFKKLVWEDIKEKDNLFFQSQTKKELFATNYLS